MTDLSINTNAQTQELTDGFHLVIDALKLNGIDTIYGLPGIPITDLTRRAQLFHGIEAEIAELPPRQREAFLMRYWEEMDVAETAAAMGCSEGSVKTHCFRAVQTLSKALKARGIEL